MYEMFPFDRVLCHATLWRVAALGCVTNCAGLSLMSSGTSRCLSFPL